MSTSDITQRAQISWRRYPVGHAVKMRWLPRTSKLPAMVTNSSKSMTLIDACTCCPFADISPSKTRRNREEFIWLCKSAAPRSGALTLTESLILVQLEARLSDTGRKRLRRLSGSKQSVSVQHRSDNSITPVVSRPAVSRLSQIDFLMARSSLKEYPFGSDRPSSSREALTIWCVIGGPLFRHDMPPGQICSPRQVSRYRTENASAENGVDLALVAG
eukprot:3933311-Rhodomonas_salina.1